MIKLCFITTVSMTLKAFVMKTAEYLHENGDYDISFICDYDPDFAASLPDHFTYYPVLMKRGISLDMIKSIREMRRVFEKQKFDLIQYSTPNASLYASIAGWLTRVPVRLYCQWGLAYVAFSGIKRYIFKQEEKFVCRLSTWIEPDSRSNLEFARHERLYPEKKSSVVWNGSACGVDLAKFDFSKKTEYRKCIRQTLGIPDDSFVFGFVGRITRDKGINELLEATKVLTEAGKKFLLMIVGRDETNGSLDESLMAWSKKSSCVIYCGFTNVVEQYLAAMDCFVMPSYREGFGMGIVEAEAMGVPVISSDIPGPRDAMVSEETGILIEKASVKSLAVAMETMMLNQEKANEYGAAGINFARRNFNQPELMQYILEDRERLLSV